MFPANQSSVYQQRNHFCLCRCVVDNAPHILSEGPDGVLVFDAEEKVQYWNSKAQVSPHVSLCVRSILLARNRKKKHSITYLTD